MVARNGSAPTLPSCTTWNSIVTLKNSSLLHRIDANAHGRRRYKADEIFQFFRIAQLRREFDVVASAIAQAASCKGDHGELVFIPNAEDPGLLIDPRDGSTEAEHASACSDLRIHKGGNQANSRRVTFPLLQEQNEFFYRGNHG